MGFINMDDAKTRLSQLVEAVENGETDGDHHRASGQPVARLVPITPAGKPKTRIGVAKGLFTAPADPQADGAEVAALFMGSAGPGYHLTPHIAEWALTDDPRLSSAEAARARLLDQKSEICVSAVTLWEITIKLRSGIRRGERDAHLGA